MNDDAKKLAAELEKYLPQFNKKKSATIGDVAMGLIYWAILAALACCVAWICGAIAGFAVSGFKIVTHLLG